MRRLSSKISALWTNGRTIERIGYAVAMAAFASGLFHLVVFAVAGGSWTGPVSWRKPVTFGLSFGVVLATIVWVSTYIAMGRRLRHVLVGAFTLASAIEVAGISTQQWRGVPSHFNDTDPVSAMIMRVGLAGGGVVLTAVVVTLTVLSLRRDDAVPRSMMLAVRAGLVILVAAMASGAAMIATGVVLTATDDHAAAYQVAGWLKPTHAATMHAVTVLPGLALLASCLDRDEAWRLRVVTAGVWLYVAAAVVTAVTNLVLG